MGHSASAFAMQDGNYEDDASRELPLPTPQLLHRRTSFKGTEENQVPKPLASDTLEIITNGGIALDNNDSGEGL
jgi:hypothetical protein